MAIQALSRMSGNNEMAAKNQCYLLDKDVKLYAFLYNCSICISSLTCHQVFILDKMDRRSDGFMRLLYWRHNFSRFFFLVSKENKEMLFMINGYLSICV